MKKVSKKIKKDVDKETKTGYNVSVKIIFIVFKEERGRKKLQFNIKELRKNNKLTQQELGDKAGMVKSIISKLETGATTDPNLSIMVKIADALDVTVDELIEKN